MSNTVTPIPPGYHTVTPYLILKDAARALEFYKKAFNATETVRLEGPDGKIMHAEMRIGDSNMMLGEECPDIASPSTLGGAAVSIHLYVPDADAVFNQAIKAGATEKKPMADQFFGDRMGSLVDPFGHTWSIGSRKEIVSPEELHQRFTKMMQSQSE